MNENEIITVRFDDAVDDEQYLAAQRAIERTLIGMGLVVTILSDSEV